MIGDLISLLAAVCWAAANVTIARGAGAKGDDNGAFLSILLTLVLASLVWGVTSLAQDGWPTMTPSGLWWFALGGALTMFIGRVFFHSSIQWLGAMRGSSVKRLAPLFSVLLGVLLLHEPLTWSLVAGMALIFSGFGVLVQESLSGKPPATGRPAGKRASGWREWVNPGLVYGAVSALAYALGNVARKYGLLQIPDPAFGVALGSLVGAALFVLAARFMASYRNAVRSTFTRFNPWLLAAGVLASAGQLLFFVAIDYSTVSRAALIVSTEVFWTIGLTMLVVRTQEKLSRATVIAALLGVLGTVVIMADDGPVAQGQRGPTSTLAAPASVSST